MFTGLIESMGTVDAVRETGSGRRIRVGAPGLALEVGASVAIDGVCLTATDVTPDAFTADAIGTTCSRTILGLYRAGALVNIERPLKLQDRLGGHFVQGHVDDLGWVERLRRAGEGWLLDVGIPPEVESATVLHGSIAINGVSLTVNALSSHLCQVAIIPHTWTRTNLHALEVGDPVNLESDLIGKYVVRMIASQKGRELRTRR